MYLPKFEFATNAYHHNECALIRSTGVTPTGPNGGNAMTTATGTRLGIFGRLGDELVKLADQVRTKMVADYKAEEKAITRFKVVMATLAGRKTKMDYSVIISECIRRGDLEVVPGIRKGDVLRYLSSLIPTSDDDIAAIKIGVERVRGAAHLDEDDFWTLVRGASYNPIADVLEDLNNRLGF